MLAVIWNEPVDPSPLPGAYRAYLEALQAPSLASARSVSVSELIARGPFDELREESVPHRQTLPRDEVLAFARSVSWIAHRPEERAGADHA